MNKFKHFSDSDGLAKWLRARMLNERSEVLIPHQENKYEKKLPQK